MAKPISPEIKNQAKALFFNEDLNCVSIAKKLNIGESSVRRWLKVDGWRDKKKKIREEELSKSIRETATEANADLKKAHELLLEQFLKLVITQANESDYKKLNEIFAKQKSIKICTEILENLTKLLIENPNQARQKIEVILKEIK